LDDSKYTFVIYRSHCFSFQNKPIYSFHSDNLNKIRHLKYLHATPLFVPFILNSKQ
jgi:hypothetical protein